jgi:hypothetical protein
MNQIAKGLHIRALVIDYLSNQNCIIIKRTKENIIEINRSNKCSIKYKFKE